MERALRFIISKSRAQSVTSVDPQLFYCKNTSIEIIAVKIFDDVPNSRKISTIQNSISSFKNQCNIGFVAYGPRKFLFFGTQTTQKTGMIVSVQFEKKIEHLGYFPIDQCWRKRIVEQLNAVEPRSIRSANNSIGWLVTNDLLLYSYYSSWLEQRAPNLTVHDLILQVNALKRLQRHDKNITYSRPKQRDYNLSVLIFADASL